MSFYKIKIASLILSAGLIAESIQAADHTMIISNAAGLTASIDLNGRYVITSHSPQWNFAGDLGALPVEKQIASGMDRIGSYSEISFQFTNGAAQRAGIRLYQDQPIVLFSDTYLGSSANELAFPRLTTYPTRLHHISFGGIFGRYDFKKLHGDSPWLYFDNDFNSFLISPASNFMIAHDTGGLDEEAITCGIDPAVSAIPANFTHKTILVIQNGINRTFDMWGNALTEISGKVRPANDASVELNKLGYWTDNGAFYYYHYDAQKGYIGTLLAIRDEFARNKVPLGYLQLDSWWYPKSRLATWQGTTNDNRGGIYLFQAAPKLFPKGLAAFQNKLGLPLITHARWIDPASPYRTNHVFSRNVPTDRDYWKSVMDYIGGAGVVTYEQDWLNQEMLPLMNLHDPAAFMDEMASEAAAKGINLQYCMPLPRHYMQGSLYNNLLTMRVSLDHFQPKKWTPFLYDSRFVDSVGAWPWTDVFMSSEDRNLLIGTLSDGPVGVGGALGAINVVNLSRVIRPDSIIVKPDASLLPTDESYLNDSENKKLPMTASTYTDHNGLKTFYVFSYAQEEENSSSSFKPAALGSAGDTYVYDYFKHSGKVVKHGDTFHFTTSRPNAFIGGSYFVIVPIGPSGIAFIGDTNKYVTSGKKRISELSDDGVIHVKIQFAPIEGNVTLTGYAPSKPGVSATVGSISSLAYDPTNHLFSFVVASDQTSTAAVTITPQP